MRARKLYYKGYNGVRAVKNWVVPYVNSRLSKKGELRPLIGFLVTDWKCNFSCHYCFLYKEDQPGMTWETAKASLDWLKSLGCGVIGITGGEPLVRKDLILKIVEYGNSKGMLMNLATNGYLMDKPFIDELGAAGIASINLAVDCVKATKGMPKALMSIEPQFRYLLERQKKYNYILFFNINICKTNIKDVRLLTEIARVHNIGTDYHLNELPQEMANTEHYKNLENDLWITPDMHAEIDELIDWLKERQKSGWAMVNPPEHFNVLKKRMRGSIPPWDCRAGQNGLVIRPDGTLTPCYILLTNENDWGSIGAPKFDKKTLDAMKKKCVPECTSICFYALGHYYDASNLYGWVRQHTRMG
ncbi:MAG: radical SAM protein [Deltaproteobacteria bacterium]|nr:radical SAM protein [Deltaproteobacteria bacterium]